MVTQIEVGLELEHVLRVAQVGANESGHLARRGEEVREDLRPRCGDRVGLVDEVEDGVRWNNRIAEETGFLDAFDSHYNEIIQGLDIELFPESEIEILQEFGSKDPKSKLRGIIYILKERNKDKFQSCKEESVSNQLKNIVEQLSDAQDDFKETNNKSTNKKERPRKSRRWFKGLGQIGQGAALSIGDIALAAGVLSFPVSPETQTWGALVSATTGVGMIMNGVGELRGE